MANHNSIKIKLESIKGRATQDSRRNFPFRGRGSEDQNCPKSFFSKERIQKPYIQFIKSGIKNTENQYTIDALA